MKEENKDNGNKPPRIFISYSWTNQEHENWVLNFAERLVGDGVDVILDKWELKEGQDKYVYMEKMVTDENVGKVLMLCDKKYAEKADTRTGGVGTESQIISKEIYDKVKQDKFIPIVLEYENDRPCLPVFLGSRMYFNFSTPQDYAEDYERLLRNIFDKPLYKKPPIGKPLSFLDSDSVSNARTRTKLELFRNALLNDKSTYKGIANDFLSACIDSLEDFRIDSDPADMPIDDFIYQKIHDMLPLRNDIIEFIKLYIIYKCNEEFIEQISTFMEECLKYEYPKPDVRSFNDIWFDHYRFFIHEMFLYLIVVLLQNKKYSEISTFLSKYYLDQKNKHYRDGGLSNYMIFEAWCHVFEYRNQRLKANRLSLMADLIKERCNIKTISFDDIMEAEMFLFIRSIIDSKYDSLWYPHTLHFARYTGSFPLFLRAASKQVFRILRMLLGVQNKIELEERLSAGFKKYDVQRLGFHDISFTGLMNFDKLDTL